MLQLAAAALLVDRARRVRAKAAFFFQVDEAAEGEAFFDPGHFNLRLFVRQRVRHENREAVDFGDAGSFVC